MEITRTGILFGPWATAVILHETMHKTPKNVQFSPGISLNFDRCFGENGNLQNDIHCRSLRLDVIEKEALSRRKFLKNLPRAALYVEMPTQWAISDGFLHIHFDIVHLIDDAALVKAYRPLTLRLNMDTFWQTIISAGEALRRQVSLACVPDAWGNPWVQLDVPAVFANLPWETSDLI